MAFLELILENEGLHSHKFYANIRLFKDFIENFIAFLGKTESK